MLMAGQKVENRFVIKQNHREELMEIIQDMPELPEIFICANDFVATDLMQALAAAGKRVPEDVRLCGFDDSAESRQRAQTGLNKIPWQYL